MADLSGFDAEQVEPVKTFEPLPEGKYLAVITDSEWKPTKAGTGRYLQFAFQIMEGGCKGRVVWTRLNLENRNATTVEISRGELSAICRAVGVMKPKDSTELHNLPLVVYVRCKRRSDTGAVDNVVAGYEAKPQAAASPAAAGDEAAPWARSS